MTIANLHLSSPAPDIYHFLPLILYPFSVLLIDVYILVASDDATYGSVIAKHDLISPYNKGNKYFIFYSLFA